MANVLSAGNDFLSSHQHEVYVLGAVLFGVVMTRHANAITIAVDQAVYNKFHEQCTNTNTPISSCDSVRHRRVEGMVTKNPKNANFIRTLKYFICLATSEIGPEAVVICQLRDGK